MFPGKVLVFSGKNKKGIKKIMFRCEEKLNVLERYGVFLFQNLIFFV